MEISWSLPDRRKAVPWGVVGGTIAAGIAVQFGADSEAMIWAAVGIAALIVIVIRAWRPERPFGRRSRLVVGRTGWRLDQRIGWRREPYTGTGALEATYVFSTDVPGGRRVVELRSDGKLVTTIGEGLTEPELRFIIQRIREATSLHSAPLPASDP